MKNTLTSFQLIKQTSIASLLVLALLATFASPSYAQGNTTNGRGVDKNAIKRG